MATSKKARTVHAYVNSDIHAQNIQTLSALLSALVVWGKVQTE